MDASMRFRASIHHLLAAALLAAATPAGAAESPVERMRLLQLPPGFSIDLYADGVDNARQLALGDRGTVFAGSRKAGRVHAVVDSDGDQRADRVYEIDRGLDMPSGIAFRDGSLYVAAVDRVLRYDAIEDRLEHPPEPVLVTDELPDKTHHGWKYLRFGPDGLLYVPVGAPCNICDEPGFAQIRRMAPDGSGMETYAEGVRNSVGMAFHPQTGVLWFTDNGRDMLGDDLPGDELNEAPRPGMHFGYPYCHQGDLPDPEFGQDRSCADYTAPALTLGPHVAALGLSFYTGTMFPPEYHGQLFVAQHGSWNRSEKIGYDLLLVRFDAAGRVAGSEVFASGWLQGQQNWGRPVDVLQMPDGALLVADDQAGVIYRVSYRAPGP
jgi:glucose/arabinose dehydrogenase